jgi:hypothetical protein
LCHTYWRICIETVEETRINNVCEWYRYSETPIYSFFGEQWIWTLNWGKS